MAVRRRYSTRLLLSLAALGAAGGLLSVALNYSLLWVPPSTLSFTIYSIVTPVWFIAPFIAVALFRLPGAGIITALIGGLVNFVTPYGLAQLLNFLVAGACIELPFLLAGYRRWSDRAVAIGLAVGGALMSAAYFLVCWFGGAIDPGVLLPWLAVLLVAGILLVSAGVAALALVIARRLAKAGLGARRTDAATA